MSIECMFMTDDREMLSEEQKAHVEDDLTALREQGRATVMGLTSVGSEVVEELKEAFDARVADAKAQGEATIDDLKDLVEAGVDRMKRKGDELVAKMRESPAPPETETGTE